MSTNTKGFMGSYELPMKGSDLTNNDTTHQDRTTTKAPKTSTCFDQIAPSLLAMKTKFATMHDQLEQLKKVDDSLSQFNDAFGAFLFGLSANGATTQWPRGFAPHDFEKHPIQQQQQQQQQQSVTKKEETAEVASVVRRRKFATKEPMKTMETVLRALRLKPSGMTMDTMVQQIGIPKYRVTDCLNALIRSKDAIKANSPSSAWILHAIPPIDPSCVPPFVV
ncbi:hypothetical protein [Absidia glauca]|uniref:Uncharacterized protein n=1 Tax=Absidia glauca TaxID=4829 RepID=A0A163JIV1_ABSGL|nr:hypothetical protein [Absidia glauca]